MPSLGSEAPHDSARQHVTGQAAYIEDIPLRRNELLVGFVGSPVAHGRLTRVDVSAARALPGVWAFTAADVPGSNRTGPIFHDEEVLASTTVQHIGQPIVCLAATSPAQLAAARSAVRLDIEPLPALLTIEQAVAAGSFIGPLRRIARGDPIAALARAEHTLDLSFDIGGQEHFYLEGQAAIAVPEDGGRMTVHSSTQNPSEVQTLVAEMLGVGCHQVVCVCRRMGGGFGGKETQAAGPALLAALAAHHTGRPARVVLDQDTDFAVTGKRHPYRCRHRVGFDSDGRIVALIAEFHSDGGWSADLSLAVMERTLLHAENAYWIPHIAVSGQVCRTHKPSNTAFRGFGGPQGVAAMEHVIEAVAEFLGLDSADVRSRNLYGSEPRAAEPRTAEPRAAEPRTAEARAAEPRTAEPRAAEPRNIAPYGQIITDNTLPTVFEQLRESADYARRSAEVSAFNSRSRTHVRGLAITPVKFGISFTRRTLNQGNALVNVFRDGSVQVSTGGTEMGQGLNVKIAQLVADTLGIGLERVAVMPTSTEKNNNTSPTAASASTDLNGTAAVRAAEQIRHRLAEVAARHFADAAEGLEAAPAWVSFADGAVWDQRRPTDKRLSFREAVGLAYEQRVDLGARGFYATPGVDYNRETGRGQPFLYYTIGAAAAEVELDRFTGESRLLRADLLCDIGRSINPGVDRGQIIGGFVQGMGWATTEELVWSPTGVLLSYSATTYKVPNIQDVPSEVRLSFLDNGSNVRNVYASKAVGEPPLLLGLAVWAAIRRAVVAARPVINPVANGSAASLVKLNLPATAEAILLAMERRSAESLAAAAGG